MKRLMDQVWRRLSATLRRSEQPQANSLEEMLLEAQRICREERYELPTEIRRDRENAMLSMNFDEPGAYK